MPFYGAVYSLDLDIERVFIYERVLFFFKTLQGTEFWGGRGTIFLDFFGPVIYRGYKFFNSHS